MPKKPEKIDGSEAGVDKHIWPLYGPPVELPDTPVPEDPCEQLINERKVTSVDNSQQPRGPSRLDLSTGERYR